MIYVCISLSRSYLELVYFPCDMTFDIYLITSICHPLCHFQYGIFLYYMISIFNIWGWRDSSIPHQQAPLRPVSAMRVLPKRRSTEGNGLSLLRLIEDGKSFLCIRERVPVPLGFASFLRSRIHLKVYVRSPSRHGDWQQ